MGQGADDPEWVALARTMVTEVGMPRPWSIDGFLDRLEAWRGREIDLCGLPWERGRSTGLWQRRADHDVIAYPTNTTGAHQDHIIGHELGHMLLEHSGQCVLSTGEAQQLAPSLAPAALGHLLNHAGVAVEEDVAERFATLLLTHTVAPARPSTELGQRVEDTFA